MVDDYSGINGLADRFRTLFPDGIIFDADNIGGAKPMRDLDQPLLARILPVLLAGLDTGNDLVSISGRWLTPFYRSGELELIFILPPGPRSRTGS